MRGFLRKQIVNLKRAPQRIPLVILVVCCIIYTFNLTAHSNASIYVNSDIVALYVFIITLASMLAIFSYVNAYSGSRISYLAKKVINAKTFAFFGSLNMKKLLAFLKRIWKLIIAVALVLIQIVLDVFYLDIMFYETMYKQNPVPITQDIAASMNMTMVHIGALVAALAAILLKPAYHKALLKIDTSALDVEDSNISDTTSIDEEFPDEDELDL